MTELEANENSLTTGVGSGRTRPIPLVDCWVNQRFPSGPTVIPIGELFTVMGSSTTLVGLLGSKRATAVLVPVSRIQRKPSGPVTIPVGKRAGPGSGNCSMASVAGFSRPMRLSRYCVNHKYPSGPSVIVCGRGSPSVGSAGTSSSTTWSVESVVST